MNYRKKYHFITQLDKNTYTLPDGIEDYREIFKYLKTVYADGLDDFNEKLAREWSIETGMIEGVYTLDRGTTQTLIESGFSADLISHDIATQNTVSSQDITKILKAQQEGLELVFQFIKDERELSPGFLHELHQLLLRHQKTTEAIDQFGNLQNIALIKGKWKDQPNNPTNKGDAFHYAPPEITVSEMVNLLRWYQEYIQGDFYHPFVLAAWLHHRFVLVHPYQDGNGRMARALASMVLIKYSYLPLIIKNEVRDQYIDALEKADEGNLQALITLFSETQLQSFENAFTSVLANEENTIEGAVKDIAQKIFVRDSEQGVATKTPQNDITRLNDYVCESLVTLQAHEQLNKELSNINQNYFARIRNLQVRKILEEQYEQARLCSTVLEVQEQRGQVLLFSVVPKLQSKFVQIEVMLFSCEKIAIVNQTYLNISDIKKIGNNFYCVTSEVEGLFETTRLNIWLEEIIKIGLQELYQRIG